MTKNHEYLKVKIVYINRSNYSTFWYRRWHYKYGNCYTFNGGLDQDEQPIRVLSTSKPGPSQGDVKRYYYMVVSAFELSFYFKSFL